jgi:hypothetical protein
VSLCAISVDLDEIDCYAGIHGLPPPDPASARAVYERAVPRFEQLFDALNVRATFFAIGRDAEREDAAATIARLHAAGHEIGNHTYGHRYDFSRLPPDAIRQEIEAGIDAIARVTGVRPGGFRAPGYLVVDAVFDALRALGAHYDSSVFPCPAYYGAKSAALAAIALRRRQSHSIMGDPRVLLAPADPYRVGKPYYRRGNGVLELPIGVTTGTSARLPFIGTSVVAAGEHGARWLTRRMLGRPLVNLELHGIDLCDAAEDGLSWLRPHQPDLRRTLDQKRRALESAIWTLHGAGYRFTTLAEAARELSPS